MEILLYKTRKILVIMSIHFKFILALFIKSLNLRNIVVLKAVLVCTYVLSSSILPGLLLVSVKSHLATRQNGT